MLFQLRLQVIRLLTSIGRLLRMVRGLVGIVGLGFHVASICRRVRSDLLALRQDRNVGLIRHVLLRSGRICRLKLPRSCIVLCQCAIVARSVSLLNGLLATLRTDFSFIRLASPLVVSVLNGMYFGFEVFSVLKVEVSQVCDQVALLVNAVLLRDVRTANCLLNILYRQLLRIAANE